MKKSQNTMKAPEFLVDLLNARSPSGHEWEAQAVVDKYIEPLADLYEKDAMGNRMATLNAQGNPTLMLAGHMDELGLMVRYVDDHGFIYVEGIGGHDTCILPGRRVRIMTAKGIVNGVTGKRAIHLMSPKEREKLPEMHDIWIDIGAKTKKEALNRVEIGDTIVYDHHFEIIHGSIATARAFDNKSGCYIVNEVLRRLAIKKTKINAKIVSVSTTQEEIGIRGAITSGYAVNPDVAIVVDVSHATDHPDCDKKKLGETYLGKGPILGKGPNINPKVLERLIECAKANNIEYQLDAEPRVTGTDARAIQISRKGVATGLVCVPLRYMHTPSEVVDLEDIERAVELIIAFAKSLKKNENFHY